MTVGNCKDCKHWGTDGSTKMRPCAKLLDAVDLYCSHPCGPDYEKHEIATDPDFGCVLWEAK